MKTSQAVSLICALIFAGCAQNDWRSSRYQWHGRARYLVEESRGLCNDVRDHLVDNERWEPQGRDRELWDTAIHVREDADRLAGRSGYYARNSEEPWEAGGWTDSIRQTRESVGRIRLFLSRENTSRELGRRLTNIDTLLRTMENDADSDEYRGRPKRGRPDREAGTRQAFHRDNERPYREERLRARTTSAQDDDDAGSRRDHVRYSEPYVGAVSSSRNEETPTRHVATHPGQSEYIRAHSAARRYVTGRHGLHNKDLHTSSIDKQGDRYVVTLESPSNRYEVTVSDSDGSVLKERVRNR